MRIKLFLLFFVVPLQLMALSFYSLDYKIKPGDDFASIIKQFAKPDAIINSKSPMIHKIRSSNPQVKNWRKLKIGQNIKFFITPDVIDMKKFKIYKGKLLAAKRLKKKKKLEEEKRKKKLAMRPSGLKSSIFYMTSAGSFTQNSASQAVNIDFSQNSPYTFGLSGLFYPKEKPYSFNASIYYSNLSASASNLSQAVEVPAEIGLSMYMQHDLYKKKFSYYGGFDYESFSTFNTGLLASGGSIKVDENKVLYLTAGVSKVFKVFTLPIFSKLSFSKSVSTSTSPAPGGVVPSKKYSGYKVMSYFNYKFHKRWFTHTLFKYHSMSGPDELSVFRYGIGFGFILK